MKRKLCFFSTLFFAALLILPWHEASASQQLRVATEGAYPPFNDIDANGKLIGFDIDIAMALCEAMEVECSIQSEAWDDLLPGLVENRYDIIIASMARTSEREQFAFFTDYYYRSRSMFAGDPQKPFIQTPNGVKGLTLAAQAGTVQEAYLRDNFGKTATIKAAEDTNACFAMLANGEADAVLSDSLTIYDFLQTEAGKHFDFVGSPLPADDPSSQACIAVRKTAPQLVEALNAALRTIRLNGVYDKINLRYFPFSIY